MVDINSSTVFEMDKYIKEKYNYNFIGYNEDFYNNYFIERESEGINTLFWLIDNDKKFLFKRVNAFDLNKWGDLIVMELAKEVGIDCAIYRPAVFNGETGFITESFLKNNEKLINAKELMDLEIKNNFSDKITNKIKKLCSQSNSRWRPDIYMSLNNYVDMIEIIDTNIFLSDLEKERIKISLKKLLCFDLITLQSDRHPENYGIIKKDNGYEFSPLYDNDASFCLGSKNILKKIEKYIYDVPRAKNYREDILEMYHNFNSAFSYRDNDYLTGKYGENKIVINKKIRASVDDIISLGDYEVKFILIQMCNKLSVDNLNRIINDLENKYKCKMDDNLRYYITNIYKNNLIYIKNKIKEMESNSLAFNSFSNKVFVK